MTTLEIVLYVMGMVCIIASFFVDKKTSNAVQNAKNQDIELTEEQKNKLNKQIEAILNEQVSNIEEITEASLDKISNTKILEMNEYADTVLADINKNHNEVMFLYDMLNEKSKEVKLTVRDVNMATKPAAKKTTRRKAASKADVVTDNSDVKDETKLEDAISKDETKTFTELSAPTVKPTRRKTKKAEPVVIPENTDNEVKVNFTNNSNDLILDLYKKGKNAKEIAKELNMGIGEVGLIIDLYSRQ